MDFEKMWKDLMSLVSSEVDKYDHTVGYKNGWVMCANYKVLEMMYKLEFDNYDLRGVLKCDIQK